MNSRKEKVRNKDWYDIGSFAIYDTWNIILAKILRILAKIQKIMARIFHDDAYQLSSTIIKVTTNSIHRTHVKLKTKNEGNKD